MQVISLSLAHLGLGLLMVHSLVGLREVGRGFFTLCGWSGAGLVALAWGISGGLPGFHRGAEGAEAPWIAAVAPWFAAVVAYGLFTASWLLLKRRRRNLASPLHRAAGVAAAVAVVLQGWSLARASPGSKTGPLGAGVAGLTGLDFLASAGLLGGVTVAMILGHWYLVQPGLSIVPLRRLVWVFIGLLAVRTVMEAGETAGAIASGAISLAPPPGEVLAFPALVLVQRALFGLAGPILLAPLVYKTVKMRSTMSATGLLYVAVALVWVGEFLSKYLLLPFRLV